MLILCKLSHRRLGVTFPQVVTENQLDFTGTAASLSSASFNCKCRLQTITVVY